MSASGLDRAGNVLGALSLAVTDRTREALSEAGELTETAAAALSALHEFLDDPSVDHLGRVIGLTSSGTVRLVRRLEQAGYVKRSAGEDARVSHVRLTQRGRRAAERVAAARAAVVANVLADLSAEERQAFDALLGRVVVRCMRGPGATKWTCRMCDMDACGRPEGRCPVANAARERWGS